MTKLLKQIRVLVIIFIVALFISGITAFPVYEELNWIINSSFFTQQSVVQKWLLKAWYGVKTAHEDFPFLFYGYDWLAYAHIAMAGLFFGVYQHPVRNRWIVQWAMLTCIGVLPIAFIAGFIRGIPFFHILIDCSFGLLGLIPLRLMQLKIKKLEKLKKTNRDIPKAYPQQ
ncbi:MAG: hypothetical protein JST21_15585 [Bacteroidetes bacterium]|nr:hypothetical protein [Bacteroidota bacterium]